MDLTDVTIPYEILIRFDGDGAFKGAHQVRRRVVTLAGEVLKDDLLPAEPLDPDGMGAAIGEAAARAIADAAALLAERDALAGELDALKTTLAHPG